MLSHVLCSTLGRWFEASRRNFGSLLGQTELKHVCFSESKHAHISLCWHTPWALLLVDCSKLQAEIQQPSGRQTELKHVCFSTVCRSLCQTSMQHGRISMHNTLTCPTPSVPRPQLLAGHQTELKHGHICPPRLALVKCLLQQMHMRQAYACHS